MVKHSTSAFHRPSRQLSCERAQQDVRPVPRYQTICFEENRTMKSRIEKKAVAVQDSHSGMDMNGYEWMTINLKNTMSKNGLAYHCISYKTRVYDGCSMLYL